MNLTHLKFPALVVGVGLLCGLVGDLLLYNQPPGVSIPIVALLMVIALLALAFVEKTEITRANLWLIAPLLLLSAFSAIRAEPLLRLMNVGGALALALLLANRLSNPALPVLNLRGYLGAWVESAVATIVIPLPLLVRAASETRSSGSPARRVTGRVLIGLVIAIPFLIVFTALFSSADLVFSRLVEDVIKVIQIPDIIGHIFLTLLLGCFAMGGLAYSLTRLPGKGLISLKASSPDIEAALAAEGVSPAAEEQSQAEKNIGQMSLRGMLGSIESFVILYSIDALFAIFVGIQFAALFGREAFIRSQGLTYSDYARRGFFELLGVSLITLCLVLAIEFVARREMSRQHIAFLVGSGLMIAMTIVILASAYERMQLYEEAYGFTRLRVYPHIFMVWLAILFAAFLIFLAIRDMRLFATAALVVAMSYVVTLDFLNPDAFIVQQNIARHQAGNPQFDVDYLGSLSEDAIPDLLPLLSDYGPAVRSQIGPWLKSHLQQMDRWHERAGIGSYHWSMSQAYNLLNARRAEIEQFDLGKLQFSNIKD